MNDKPAFPRPHSGATQYAQEGMDLRDYFAAKALQGLIHHFDFGTFRDDPMRLAWWAYDAADAMLEAREKKDA